MRMQDIEIKIGPQGEVTFEVKGVSGSRCLDVTQFLEEAVGEVREREYTPSYYAEDAAGDRAAARRAGDDEDD